MLTKDRYFIKNSKTNFKNMIIDILKDNDLDEEKILIFVNYYKMIFEDKSISDYNKNLFFLLFFETINDFIRDWLLTFISSAIIKIYKINKKTDVDLIVQNDYFVFKLLANKEIIKSFLNKKIILIDLVYDFNYHQNNFFKNKYFKSYLEAIKNKIIYINQNIEDVYVDIENETVLSFNDMQEYLFDKYEEKIISFFNEKYIFQKNENGEIVFTDFFEKFIKTIMNFEVINNKLSLKTDNQNEIKSELEKNILFCFI